MSIKYPAKLEHNNPNEPLIENTQIAGGVQNLKFFNDVVKEIPLAKRRPYMLISYVENAELKIAKYQLTDLSDIKWMDINSWYVIKTGGLPEAPLDKEDYLRNNGGWKLQPKTLVQSLDDIKNDASYYIGFSPFIYEADSGKFYKIVDGTAASSWQFEEIYNINDFNDLTIAYVAYNGDDKTGVLGNSNKPFKTFQAAYDSFDSYDDPITIHMRFPITQNVYANLTLDNDSQRGFVNIIGYGSIYNIELNNLYEVNILSNNIRLDAITNALLNVTNCLRLNINVDSINNVSPDASSVITCDVFINSKSINVGSGGFEFDDSTIYINTNKLEVTASPFLLSNSTLNLDINNAKHGVGTTVIPTFLTIPSGSKVTGKLHFADCQYMTTLVENSGSCNLEIDNLSASVFPSNGFISKATSWISGNIVALDVALEINGGNVLAFNDMFLYGATGILYNSAHSFDNYKSLALEGSGRAIHVVPAITGLAGKSSFNNFKIRGFGNIVEIDDISTNLNFLNGVIDIQSAVTYKSVNSSSIYFGNVIHKIAPEFTNIKIENVNTYIGSSLFPTTQGDNGETFMVDVDGKLIWKRLSTANGFDRGMARKNPTSYFGMGILEFCLDASSGIVYRINNKDVDNYTKLSGRTTFGDASNTALADYTLAFFPYDSAHPIEYWDDGVRKIVTATQTLTLDPDFEGYISINNSGLYADTNSASSKIIDDVLVSYIYLNDNLTGEDRLIWYADERHGIDQSGSSHLQEHINRGFYVVHGFNISGLADNATSFTAISEGIGGDEDILHNIEGVTTLPKLYKLHSKWVISDDDNKLAMFVSGHAVYNDVSTVDSEVLSAIGADRVVMNVMISNNVIHPLVLLIGQTLHATRKLARIKAAGELYRIIVNGLPSPEMRVIYSWIINNDTTGTLEIGGDTEIYYNHKGKETFYEF